MIRIIGGDQRGRKIEVPRGAAVRPPSDRARTAIFNQVCGLIDARPVLDVFAGSGVLGLESLSRGAREALFIEWDARVAGVLRNNIRHLQCESRARIVVADAFRWAARKTEWPADPALVFVAPPYAYYEDRLEAVQSLWATIIEHVPPDTAFVLHLNGRFDSQHLPPGQDWDVRSYGDVKIAICQIAGKMLNC